MRESLKSDNSIKPAVAVGSKVLVPYVLTTRTANEKYQVVLVELEAKVSKMKVLDQDVSLAVARPRARIAIEKELVENKRVIP